MDQYTGLEVRLTFSNFACVVGIVCSMDSNTQSLTLSDVTFLDAAGDKVAAYGKVVVKGSDIVDLEILSLPPVQETCPANDHIETSDAKKDGQHFGAHPPKLNDDDSNKQTCTDLPKKATLRGSNPSVSVVGMEKCGRYGNTFATYGSDAPIKSTAAYDAGLAPSDTNSRSKSTPSTSSGDTSVDSDPTTLLLSLIGLEDKAHSGAGASEASAQDSASNPSEAHFSVEKETLSSIFKYATLKHGPNTVQLIENAARSCIELLREKLACKGSLSILLVVDNCAAGKPGAISLAMGRLLVNHGHNVKVVKTTAATNTSVGNAKSLCSKYFSFQEQLAINHGLSWMGPNDVTCSFYDLIVCAEDKENDREFDHLLSCDVLFCIGGVCNRSFQSERTIIAHLLAPTKKDAPGTDASVRLNDSNTAEYCIDCGISPAIIKRYLPDASLDFLQSMFSKKSFCPA